VLNWKFIRDSTPTFCDKTQTWVLIFGLSAKKER